MDYRIDILEPDSDINVALDDLTREFAPLYTASWVNEKQRIYGKPFDMNVQTFAQLWFTKALKIFMAWDANGKPVGYLIGIPFRPLAYNSHVFQIEDWYAGGDRLCEAELFRYMETAVRFMGCDEVWISLGEQEQAPNLSIRWREASRTTQIRYTNS